MIIRNLWLFMPFKSAGPRLLAGLIEKGFTVAPGLKDDAIYHTGEVSTLVVLQVSHKNSSRDSYFTLITEIIREKEIPCFGFALQDDGAAKFFAGYMPEVKNVITPASGPYRTNGTVIPFAPKDDGIIDG